MTEQELKERLAFEHARWMECADAYAKERARRQELEGEVERLKVCPLKLATCESGYVPK